MTDSVCIASGNSVCTLLPKTGGSIGSWCVDGQDMLRAALDGTDPLQSASFPLVPYSNRIANAQFDYGGQTITLRPHPISEPHAIHGVGWQREWDCTITEPSEAIMRLRHQPDADWPWNFYAEQRIRLTKRTLELHLLVCNVSDVDMPLAFGHHCYFDSAGARLRFVADRFYPSGPDMLPLDPQPAAGVRDFQFGCTVADSVFDNCFGGWDGGAHIQWAGRRFQLDIKASMANAVLFTPPGADYFCFEPVPHINNALNHADGDMASFGPGHAYEGRICFTAIAT